MLKSILKTMQHTLCSSLAFYIMCSPSRKHDMGYLKPLDRIGAIFMLEY